METAIGEADDGDGESDGEGEVNGGDDGGQGEGDDGNSEGGGGLGDGGGGLGDGGGGLGEGGGGLGEGGGGLGEGGGELGEGGGGEGDGMRWSDTRCISSLVRPRGHTTTSAIAKSDFWWAWSPALTNSDTPPVPPLAVPTLTPFTSFSCDPASVPHMTTQSVFGLTLPWDDDVFHPL